MSESPVSRSRRRAWLWLAAIVVVGGFAAIAYLYFGSGGSSASQPSSTLSPSPTPTPSATPRETPSVSTPPVEPPSPSATPTVPRDDGALEELDAVDLRSESERPGGVVVTLEKIESVQGEATMPGDVAGPALRLTILVRNASSSELGLGTVVVNGYRDADRTPLESLVAPGGKPFGGALAPGEEARGVYIFRVGASQRADVTFTVDLKAGQPASVFRGDAR